MSATGYVINAILVLLVIRQIRGSRLDLLNLVLPVILVGAAAAYFLRSVPTAGNDVALDLALAAAGAALGFLCAAATRLWRDRDQRVVARAGIVAAAAWVAGIGARMGFAYATSHGGGPAVARFSAAHGITGGSAWVTALVMMALAEVVARLVTLRVRARRLAAGSAIETAVPQPAAARVQA